MQGVAAQAEGVLLDVSAGQSSACLYVAFGAPIAHDDDAVRAVETARRLTDPRAALAFITEVRIGLGTGRMRAGPYGSPARRTYGVLGDQTNLAARLMEAAPAGGIFASAALAAAAGGREQFVDCGLLAVKGRDEAVRLFEPKPRATAAIVAGRRAPMIGRENERRLLRNCVDLLRDGSAGRVVLLEGEPGIGKSRLLDELAECAAVASLPFVNGEASAIERSTPYYVWRSMLADALSGTPAANGSALRARLEATLHDRPDRALAAPAERHPSD